MLEQDGFEATAYADRWIGDDCASRPSMRPVLCADEGEPCFDGSKRALWAGLGGCVGVVLSIRIADPSAPQLVHWRVGVFIGKRHVSKAPSQRVVEANLRPVDSQGRVDRCLDVFRSDLSLPRPAELGCE